MNATSRLILAFVGATVGLAGQVSAQPDNPSKAPAPRPQPGAIAGDPAAILKRMEGVWKVEFRSAPSFGKENVNPGAPARPDDNQPNRDKDKPDQPDRNRDAVTTSGIAETKMVMNDAVLHQRAFMLGGLPGSEGSGTPARSQSDPVEFASYLSFDKPAERYSMVIVCGKDGSIKFGTGRFEATATRIVFESDSTDHRPDRSSPDIKPGGQNQPAINPRDSGSAYGFGDARVVLEILGNDQHKVTMYAKSPSATATPPAQPSSPAGTPARTATEQSDILYQATYTRADGAEAQRLRDLIREKPLPDRSPATIPDRTPPR
ncbi:hypothetical protein PHYC_01865 [Phycisphaerales bacterium]|nr:hypothetical protein PHYC_01865 [Phycisphaerales bacterium]